MFNQKLWNNHKNKKNIYEIYSRKNKFLNIYKKKNILFIFNNLSMLTVSYSVLSIYEKFYFIKIFEIKLLRIKIINKII